MRRLVVLLSMCLVLEKSSGCAEVGACPADETLIDGECTPDEVATPDPQTKEIGLACNIFPDLDNRPEPPFVNYELAVEPLEPIVAGEFFGARLSGRAGFSEGFLNTGQRLVPGGFKRGAFTVFHATVHVRSGAGGPDGVLEPGPTQWTCTYDDGGNTGPEAGPFPSCSQENDTESGGNEDCTGLGAEPNPLNRCLPYYDIPTSDDCSEGGICDELGQTGEGSPCELNGFCSSGPFEPPVESIELSYQADDDDTQSVLFGWADDTTGAVIEQDGPNAGTWILPSVDHDLPAGPNGMRTIIAGVRFSFECTMAVQSQGEDGVDSRDPLSSPTPDHLLIAFPIQKR